MATTEAITTDEAIRALERAARDGDLEAARRWGVELRRRGAGLDELVRHELVERCAMRWWVGVRDVDALYLESEGRTRFPRGAAAIRERIRARAEELQVEHVRGCRRCAEAEAHKEDSQRRADAASVARKAEERERDRERWARAPRALSLTDMEEALARAQGTARERTLDSDDLVTILIETAASGQPHSAEASHDVAKSYKYPVTYTTATARVVEGGIGLTVTRTATWGRREDTAASLVVPLDLVALLVERAREERGA